MKLRVLAESKRSDNKTKARPRRISINRAKAHYRAVVNPGARKEEVDAFFDGKSDEQIMSWWKASTGFKSKSSLDEKVFLKDLDGDGEAEVPDDRQGETGAPEVNMDGGLSDKDNDGDTDPASSKEPEVKDEPEVEEVPGDDELAAELAALEEDVGRMIKLKLVQEEVLDEAYYKQEDWSKIKAWQPEAHGLVYYNPQGEGPCLEPGMVRIAASLSGQGIGDKSYERNRMKLQIQQPGFFVTGENKGKLSIETVNITVDGRHVVEHGDVGFVDVTNWVLKSKGITDQWHSLLDYNGKVIATKNMQLKYSNARKCPRDNK